MKRGCSYCLYVNSRTLRIYQYMWHMMRVLVSLADDDDVDDYVVVILFVLEHRIMNQKNIYAVSTILKWNYLRLWKVITYKRHIPRNCACIWSSMCDVRVMKQRGTMSEEDECTIKMIWQSRTKVSASSEAFEKFLNYAKIYVVWRHEHFLNIRNYFGVFHGMQRFLSNSRWLGRMCAQSFFLLTRTS